VNKTTEQNATQVECEMGEKKASQRGQQQGAKRLFRSGGQTLFQRTAQKSAGGRLGKVLEKNTPDQKKGFGGGDPERKIAVQKRKV